MDISPSSTTTLPFMTSPTILHLVVSVKLPSSPISFRQRPLPKVELRRVFHRHGCVTAQASRNSAHDGEGERKRGLGMGFHRVNYTIFAAVCAGFRGRFPPPRKVSVVRREQIRVLIKTAPLPVHLRCGRPLVGGYAQTAAAIQPFNLFNCRARCREGVANMIK